MKEKRKNKNKKQNKTNQKRTRGDRSYSERVGAKWFCCAFKLSIKIKILINIYQFKILSLILSRSCLLFW